MFPLSLPTTPRHFRLLMLWIPRSTLKVGQSDKRHCRPWPAKRIAKAKREEERQQHNLRPGTQINMHAYKRLTPKWTGTGSRAADLNGAIFQARRRTKERAGSCFISYPGRRATQVKNVNGKPQISRLWSNQRTTTWMWGFWRGEL